jgi:lysophospholipase L1-like esterase/dienelactone hydrolase
MKIKNNFKIKGLSLFLFILLLSTSNGFSQEISKKNNLRSANFLSLELKVLTSGNQVDSDGLIRKFKIPVIHLYRTKTKLSKGTILLFPGGGYAVLSAKAEGEYTAHFLNSEGFDVALLEYHIASGSQTRDLALADALKAYRLIKSNPRLVGLHEGRIGMMGFSAGGHLAARIVKNLNKNELPNDLILIYPAYLNETLQGTVIPSVMPPREPTGRLFSLISSNDNPEWVKSCQEYTKMWRGFDGLTTFHLLPNGGHGFGITSNPADALQNWTELLKSFLNAKIEVSAVTSNPAAVPVAGYSKPRHEMKLAELAKEKYNLLMIGNSITNNFDKAEYQSVWNQFFAPRKAINLGYSGYRTENILWNLENGELEGQSPKVVTLEIGTNNIDEKNYPTRHTAGQLAGGIEAIVKLIRQKLPDSKIVLLRCFPGCYGGPNPTSHRFILERASDINLKLVDNQHVFYCDVNHVFLNLDGSINHTMMSDWLHPTPAGAKAWAQAMEPLLSTLMGDKSLDTELPTNSALIPVSKLELDSYDWFKRHADVMRIKDSINPEIVLIGNSITHFWGGEPKVGHANGPKTWASLFGAYRVLNLGFGWDRTQNVLWRLDHGEIDGLHPKIVVINIGTNNTSQTQNARMNTASEIVEGIRAICLRVRSKLPEAKIVLMGVFPREESPTHPRRLLINEINQLLSGFANEQKITYVDLTSKMVSADGTISKEIMFDFCHPTEKGYQIWADQLRGLLSESQ